MISSCPVCKKYLTNRIVGTSKMYSIEKYCKNCGYVEKMLDADDKSMNILVGANYGQKARG